MPLVSAVIGGDGLDVALIIGNEYLSASDRDVAEA